MKAIRKRLFNLENRIRLGQKEPLVVVVSRTDRQVALDHDTCVRILRESGFLPTHTIGMVYLTKMPDRLDAKETERFLRENGALICGPGAPFE